MLDNGGIRLLPQTRKKIDVKTPGQNKLLVFSFLFVMLIFAFYGGLFLYKKSLFSNLNSIEENIVTLEKSRNKSEEQKILDFKEKLKIVTPLINNHIYWSNGFGKFQSLVSPRVQLESINVSVIKAEFNFKAITDSYTTLAKQIAAFYGDDTITDVILGKVASLSTGKLEFSMQINFDVNKLLKKNLLPATK